MCPADRLVGTMIDGFWEMIGVLYSNEDATHVWAAWTIFGTLINFGRGGFHTCESRLEDPSTPGRRWVGYHVPVTGILVLKK